MKKFLTYFVIVVLFAAWGIVLTNSDQVREVSSQVAQVIQKPCSKPITYSIGEVSEEFGVTRERFQELVFQSEYIWEKSFDKNLFQYDANSDFKINLIFDERQKRTIESEKMENSLGDLEASYESAQKQYNSLNLEYRKKIDNYNSHVKEYEKKLDRYNEEVAYWNSRGGAPEEEYEDLKDDKKELDKMFSSLEKERKEVNALIGKTNDLAEKSNDLAENYNQNLNTYKNKFGSSVQFDKGLYDGKSISVYQFYEETDLVLTLSHEFGHALGIEHVENPKSLMYYLMGEQDIEDPKLSEQDLAAVKQVCQIE